jgi:hypothetical protein
MKHWKTSSKRMAGLLGISLSWLVLSADLCNPCHESTKEEKYPFTWVACVDNKPVLFKYFGNFGVPIGTGSLNPKDWDCTKGDSPKWVGSGAPSSQSGSSSGPYSKTPESARSATFTERFLTPALLPLRSLPGRSCLPETPLATPATPISFT